ncbi:low molecular weight protein-tyrosine-phosphatase [Endozoicomonas sp. ONNA2]|uniref:low molecular weight protein-tyrosine-phosphatase n=1 Tax=Endozoicomonas sp. ONNA2 TaxID=2828741 RepID=UPI002148DCCF|nr:low molecular weight protein-tyrosine-phosphatase [Endozoicomonas sp. ONNA2]
MFNTILVVCVGNICRSPTAEYMFRKQLNCLGKNINVQSAGLGAPVGKPAAEPATQLAAQHGIDLSPHIARQLTAEMIHEHDLILVMEENHIKECESITPAARGKTHLLGRWNNGIEIPDPYRKGDIAYELAFDLIQTSVNQWVYKLFT